MKRVRDLVYIALFTALIAVCAQITIPTTIPFTLQTFAIFLAVAMLRDFRALFSVAIYIFLGAVGVPVFAGFKGGFGVLASATGGFIIGFILIPIVMILFYKLFKYKIWASALSMVLGLLLCYLCGSLWFGLVYTARSITFWEILKICVIPFLLFDTAKIVLAVILSDRLLRIGAVRRSLNLPDREIKRKAKESKEKPIDNDLERQNSLNQ